MELHFSSPNQNVQLLIDVELFKVCLSPYKSAFILLLVLGLSLFVRIIDLAIRMLANNAYVRVSFGTYAIASHKPSTINPDRNTLLLSSVKCMPNGLWVLSTTPYLRICLLMRESRESCEDLPDNFE